MASVIKPTPALDATNVETIRSELDTLQRERRVAELRLRDLDAKRRMVPIPARGPVGLTRAGGPGGPWISDRDKDRRPEFDRGFERDRPHPWDRLREPDRPHPWDVHKGPEDRRLTMKSTVSRGGERESRPVEPSRPVKRLSGGDEKEEDWKPNKRRFVEAETTVEKEEGETEKFEGEIKGKNEEYEQDDGADLVDRDAEDAYNRSGRRVSQLSSVVSLNTDDAAKKERTKRERPERIEKAKLPLSENTEVKQRNRKMFGALLGHLQKAKKEEEQILQKPTMVKRAEIEEKVEVLARESGEVIRRKLSDEMREERRKNLEQIRMVRSRQQAALHLLAMARADTQCNSLCNFIRTVATPEIFWRPGRPEAATTGIMSQLTRTQNHIRAAANETKARMEAERAADLEEEARQSASLAQRYNRVEHVEVAEGGAGEEEHAEAAEPGTGGGGATAAKEQAVEEVDDEEGADEMPFC